MYTTILKLIWPYLMRFASSQAADYLKRRREQRLSQPEQSVDVPEDCPPCPPCPPEAEMSASNAFWYSLSGVVLGSSLSLMLYILFKEDDAR